MSDVQQLYEKKCFLLDQMLKTTKLLAKSDQSKQWDDINALITERQKYIEDIDLVDGEIKKLKEAPSGKTSQGRLDADCARGKCLRVTSEIRELDFKQLGKLNRQLAVLQQQLSETRAGRKAFGAYTDKHGPEGMLVDRKK